MSGKSKGSLSILLFVATSAWNLFVATSAWSQTAETGAISGTIHDPSGAVMVRVAVDIVNTGLSSHYRVAAGQS